MSLAPTRAMEAINPQMDVRKQRSRSRWRGRPAFAVAAVLAVALVALGGRLLLSGSERRVPRADVLLGTVQQGDLRVSVDGYGVLRSNKQALITALTVATIQEVVLRPGALVEPDSVILRLANPDLIQEVNNARISLDQESADLRRLAMTNQRDLLSEQTILAKARSDYEAQRMRNEAQKDLAAEGIVPKLDYEAAVLNEHLLLESMQLQQKRIEQLKVAARQSEIIQQEKIDQAKASYETVKDRADHLTVRAGLKGVLQRLPVELGQTVTAGQELALVGGGENLVALIRISQAKADQIKTGQTAEINTRRELAPGVVTRVAPEVEDGTIEVEVKFVNGPPPSARPELNVDAKINIATLHDVLYIERPTNAQANTAGKLFLLQQDGRHARAQEVHFGEESGTLIQLTRGARAQERFILSDMGAYRDAKQILLAN